MPNSHNFQAKNPEINFTRYAEFWNYYLSVHQSPWTQRIHVFGTLVGVTLFFLGSWYRRPLWMLFAFVCGYGFAWSSHFFIEKNRPATFQYPLWSFASDFRLLYFFIKGGFKALKVGSESERTLKRNQASL